MNQTRKLVDLINIFRKLSGNKINMQTSVAFIYTNNELAVKDIRIRYPFHNIKKKLHGKIQTTKRTRRSKTSKMKNIRLTF